MQALLAAWIAIAAAPSEGTAAIAWQAPPECPPQAAVNDRLRTLLGREAMPELAVARVERGTNGHYHATLSVVGMLGPRTLESRSCEALGSAVALVVAVSQDPVATAETVATAVSPSASPAPDLLEEALVPELELETASESTSPSSRISAGTDIRAAKPRSPRSVRGAARALAGVGIGALDRPRAGVSVATALVWPRARIELAGSHWFGATIPHPADRDVSATVRSWIGALRGCPVIARSVFELRPCLGVELGAMVAAGAGLEHGRTARALWGAVSIAPTVAWVPRPWFSLVLDVDAFVAFVRPRFVVDDLPGDLLRAGPAGLRIMLGPELRFP